jgi:D-cysteine desulfhydrase
LTAAAGARLGLDVVLVLAGADTGRSTGNLALSALFGASVVWAGDGGDAALRKRVSEVEGELRESGRAPAVIPFGGSSALSTDAYLAVAREIQTQGVDPDHVVVAVGSGGTMAGLIRGFGAERVLGVHCGAVADPHQTVRDLLPANAGDADVLRIRLDQVGPGYSQVSDAVMEALAIGGRTEGIVFDPIYTGRALAGLIAELKSGGFDRESTVVLMHTGGLPGLFGSEEFLDKLSGR